MRSRYQRQLADAAMPVGESLLGLPIRRFSCGDVNCASRTFAEQVEGLTICYGRRTMLLRRMLEPIGLAAATIATVQAGHQGPTLLSLTRKTVRVLAEYATVTME